jgi:hypothetical protein
MAKGPVFMYGPKDGSPVPVLLYPLEVVEMCHHLPSGDIIYIYERNVEDNNYYFKGQFRDEDGR